MKNTFCISLFVLFISNAFSQCPDDNVFIKDITPDSAGVTITDSCAHGGTYYTVSVITGEIYVFATCLSDSVDTEMALYTDAGSVLKASDDDGCGITNGPSQIIWKADFTGVVRVVLDSAGCDTTHQCIQLEVTHVMCNSSTRSNYSEVCNGTVSYSLAGGLPLYAYNSNYIVTNTAGTGDVHVTNNNKGAVIITISNLLYNDYYDILISDSLGCLDSLQIDDTYDEHCLDTCPELTFSGLNVSENCGYITTLEAEHYSLSQLQIRPGIYFQFTTNGDDSNKVSFYRNGSFVGCSGPGSCTNTFPTSGAYTLWAGGQNPNAEFSIVLCETGTAEGNNMVYEARDIISGELLVSGVWDATDSNKCQTITIPCPPRLTGIGYFYGPGVVAGQDSSGVASFRAYEAGPGSHTIYYYWNNENGCSGLDSQVIEVVLPTVFAGKDTIVCPGDTVELGGNPTASGTFTAYKYEWSPVSDLDSVNVANPTAIPNKTTDYIVTVSHVGLPDQDMCDVTDTMTVTTFDVPSINIQPEPAEICKREDLFIRGNPSGGSGNYIHEWITADSNDLSSFDQSNTVFSTDTIGDFKVIYKVTDDNSCNNSDSLYILVHDLPDITLDTVSPICKINGKIFASVTYEEDSNNTNGIFTYDWSVRPYIHNDSVTGLIAGKHYVTVTDEYGCTDIDSVTLNRKPCDTVKIPNVFTPNGDQWNNEFDLDDIENGIPNGSVTVGHLEQYVTNTLTIYNRWGKKVNQFTNYRKEWTGQNKQGNDLPAGVYFYILELPDGIVRKGTVTIIR